MFPKQPSTMPVMMNAGPRHFAQHGADVYIERLEMMLRAAWPQAVQGDLKAVMVCLRVLRQEAKFYGLGDGVEQYRLHCSRRAPSC
jgi:hypothetical protein